MSKLHKTSINVAPYRIYSLLEFHKLATLGIWPGANVEGIGYVHNGKPIPKYIAVYNSKWMQIPETKTKTFLDKINSGILYGGIGSGVTEHGKFGSINYRYKGGNNPMYYDARLGKGGGVNASIETLEISGKVGLGNMTGKVIAIVGIGTCIYIGVDAVARKDYQTSVKAGVDLIMTRIGMMGLPGFIIGTVYFLIDPLDPNKRTSESHSKEITPIDNLRIKQPILKDVLKSKKMMLNIKEQSIVKPKFLF